MAGLIDRQLLNGGLGRARDSDHDMAAAEGLLTANEREGREWVFAQISLDLLAEI